MFRGIHTLLKSNAGSLRLVCNHALHNSHFPSGWNLFLVFGVAFFCAGRLANAQFTYATSNGVATVIGYTGTQAVVTIPDTASGLPVKAIGDYAFYNIGNLASVTIPQGITNIGDHAFDFCRKMTNVSIPGTVLSIGASAFSRVPVRTLDLPEGLLRLGDYAFRYCDSVVGVSIPVTLTDVGTGTFQFCTGLPTVSIPDNIANIPPNTFEYCSGLTNVSIAKGVLTIGPYAFRNCTSLGSIVIPGTVSSIGMYAFDTCSSLTNITILNGVASIESRAFQYCTNLTTLTLPPSVISMGTWVFAFCSSLQNLFCTGDYFDADPSIFIAASPVVYYLPGTQGWGSTFAGRPALLWNPTIQTGSMDFGVRSNRFAFTITGTTNIPLVIERCSTLVNSEWHLILNCTLTNGAVYLSDGEWPNRASAFYRVRSP
jgi:hypothetical protein